MDLFSFYGSVLDDEIGHFQVTQKKLEASARIIKKAYSLKSLQNGETYVDYNVASHRCAYLYKFGPSHTEMSLQHFRRFIAENSEVRSILQSKSALKICCLGGGAGSDALGLLIALTKYPHLCDKVREVTVLDICYGWRNTFERIMEKFLQDGASPGNLIQQENFSSELVEVDLLEKPTDAALKAIQCADIICMVKFVSAVSSKSTAKQAFQNISRNMKDGAIVIFIDNLSVKVHGPIRKVFSSDGLRCVLGPLRDTLRLRGSYSFNFKAPLDFEPLRSTRLSVLGWIKMLPCSLPYIRRKNYPTPLHASQCSINLWSRNDEESQYGHNYGNDSDRNVSYGAYLCEDDCDYYSDCSSDCTASDCGDDCECDLNLNSDCKRFECGDECGHDSGCNIGYEVSGADEYIYKTDSFIDNVGYSYGNCHHDSDSDTDDEVSNCCENCKYDSDNYVYNSDRDTDSGVSNCCEKCECVVGNCSYDSDRNTDNVVSEGYENHYCHLHNTDYEGSYFDGNNYDCEYKAENYADCRESCHSCEHDADSNSEYSGQDYDSDRNTHNAVSNGDRVFVCHANGNTDDDGSDCGDDSDYDADRCTDYQRCHCLNYSACDSDAGANEWSDCADNCAYDSDNKSDFDEAGCNCISHGSFRCSGLDREENYDPDPECNTDSEESDQGKDCTCMPDTNNVDERFCCCGECDSERSFDYDNNYADRNADHERSYYNDHCHIHSDTCYEKSDCDKDSWCDNDYGRRSDNCSDVYYSTPSNTDSERCRCDGEFNGSSDQKIDYKRSDRGYCYDCYSGRNTDCSTSNVVSLLTTRVIRR